MPVEYRTISIVAVRQLSAASINRATSSTPQICGNRRGALGYGVSLSRYGRFNVLTKEEAQRRDVEAHGQAVASSARAGDTPGTTGDASD